MYSTGFRNLQQPPEPYDARGYCAQTMFSCGVWTWVNTKTLVNFNLCPSAPATL